MSSAPNVLTALVPESIRSSTSMEANGTGWSSLHECFVYSEPIDSDSNSTKPVNRSSSVEKPRPQNGFYVRLEHTQLIEAVYLDHSIQVDSESNMLCFVNYFSPSYFSSLENVEDFVDQALAKFGVPDIDRDSLIQIVHSFGRDHRESSQTKLVPLCFEFIETLVFQDVMESIDWLYKGTVDSVIVKKLKVTYSLMNKLIKSSVDGGSSSCKGNSCTICFEDFQEGDRVCSLPCSHKYHNKCICGWFRTSNKCPLCRFPLPWIQTHFPSDADADVDADQNNVVRSDD